MSSIVLLSVLVLLCASGLSQADVTLSRRDWLEKKQWGSVFRQATGMNNGWNTQGGQDPSAGQVGQDPSAGQVGQDPSAGQFGQDGSAGQVGQDGSAGQDGSFGQGGQDGSFGQAGQDGSFGQGGQVGQDGSFGQSQQFVQPQQFVQVAPVRQNSFSKSSTRIEKFKFKQNTQNWSFK